MKLFRTKRIIGFSLIQLIFLGGLLFVLFVFGNNNIFQWSKNQTTIRRLNTQIENYRQEAEMYGRKRQELHSNTHDLEKFARENFLMKRDNEDVFVIID